MVDVQVRRTAIGEVETPLLIVGHYLERGVPEGPAGIVDGLLGGLLTRAIQSGEVSGELGSVAVFHNLAGSGLRSRRVVVVGLGARRDVVDRGDLEPIRIAAATGARTAAELKVESCATVALGAGDVAADEACRATVESAILALYRFRPMLDDSGPNPAVVRRIDVLEEVGGTRDFQPIVETARRTCEAVELARDLSTGSGNVVTPTSLARRAVQVGAAAGIDVDIWGPDELRRRGMHAILAVSAGSAQPPVLAAMRYRSPGAHKTLAIVGKGVTFDAGGISIKPGGRMQYARHDMSGAAAVLSFMGLAASTRLPVNLLGLFPATENLPSGSAYKPGDVFTTYNGKTIEIINTDAEGRVILADALAYAAEQKPDAIIDLATLTGATRTAVGDHATGLFANDQPLADLLIEAGVRSGEWLWQFPMWRVYKRGLETPMADLRNVGGGGAGGIVAALFLEEFVSGVPWAHLDMGGTGYVDDDQAYTPPYLPKRGGTGMGVRLLWHFCRLWLGT